MKHLSLQWRITLLTALLIAAACICLNLLLSRSGTSGMDSLNIYVTQYQPGESDGLAIEIPDEEMADFLNRFSQEVYDAKTIFGRKGWIITAVVTMLSGAIAYFVSGKALQPLKELSRQAEKINQDSIANIRLDENSVREFRQLSRSVNHMLDRLAQSFDLQRQFAGNAAHELRTPLAILQTKLELFAEEHPDMDGETAELVSSLREQINRLTVLVRALLEMSNLQAVSRGDHIELAPLTEEILADLTPLAQQSGVALHEECEDINLVDNGIKYNRPGGSVSVTVHQEADQAVLRVSDTGCGIPNDLRENVFQPFFRVDKSRSRKMGGAGLGLALVREISILHGGNAEIEESSDQGTVFLITLPKKQEG